MVEIGYHLSSEEHPAPDLVGYARRAEEVGFSCAVVSDHFHPWTHRQGQSPFVWAVLGAIAQATKRLRLGTAITAPIRRTPPYLVAHAAATVATLLPGRFFLGVGTGENLNEHIIGEWWPPSGVRREMLEEAVEIIRKLWAGETVEHFGRHYTVDNARLYSRPSEPPPIVVATGGEAGGARRPNRRRPDLGRAFGGARRCVRRSGRQGQTAVRPDRRLRRCGRGTGATDRACAVGGSGGDPAAAACEPARTGRLPGRRGAARRGRGLRARRLRRRPRRAPRPNHRVREAGFDHVHLHQVGADQETFFRFYENELLSRVREL